MRCCNATPWLQLKNEIKKWTLKVPEAQPGVQEVTNQAHHLSRRQHHRLHFNLVVASKHWRGHLALKVNSDSTGKEEKAVEASNDHSVMTIR